MAIFTLSKIQEVIGRISFNKLVIDGTCPYDEFCEKIIREGNLKGQLIGLINNMNQVANLRRLPREKFRDITPSGAVVKEFEIKKGDLRVYVIKEEGHIVVLGGKKNTQDEDIRYFRSLKKAYFEFKKSRKI